MNTIENNKLIAEFMGLEINNKHYLYKGEATTESNGTILKGVMTPFRTYFLNELKFHTSYDWLMPVVEKIESIEDKYEFGTDYYDFHIMPDAVIVCKQSDEGNPLILINKSDGIGTIQAEIITFESKLEATYKAVIEFIKWYNENKEA